MNAKTKIIAASLCAILVSSGAFYLTSKVSNTKTSNQNLTASQTLPISNADTKSTESFPQLNQNKILATRVAAEYKFTNLSMNAYIQHPCSLKQNYFATSSSIKTLNLRDCVITEGQSKNGFSKIRSGNQEGYVETSNLTYNQDSIFELVSPFVMYSKLEASLYSRYTNSSNEQTVTASFPLNEEVVIIADNRRNWYEVKYKNQYGYIPKDNLMKTKISLDYSELINGSSTYYVNSNAQKYNLQTDNDIDTFTAIVMAEGGNGGYEGCLATASAILNRCDAGTYFGGHDVLYMMGQNNLGIFWSEAYHYGRHLQYKDHKYSKICQQATMDAINGKRNHHFRDFSTPDRYWAVDAKQWPVHWECGGNMFCDGTK